MVHLPLLRSKLSVSLIIGLIFLFAGTGFAVNSPSPGLTKNTDSTESVHAILSGLSDEQVRELLIAELKKDAVAEKSSFSLETITPGPASPAARMLKFLDNESAQSELKLKKLWDEIPNLLPDLYKVFVSL